MKNSLASQGKAEPCIFIALVSWYHVLFSWWVAESCCSTYLSFSISLWVQMFISFILLWFLWFNLEIFFLNLREVNIRWKLLRKVYTEINKRDYCFGEKWSTLPKFLSLTSEREKENVCCVLKCQAKLIFSLLLVLVLHVSWVSATRKVISW